MQRRNHYRVAIPADSDFRLRVWRIPENVRLKDKPNTTAELKAVLKDMSVGGVGVILSAMDGGAPKISEGERLRLDLKVGEAEPLTIEGRMLTPRSTGPAGILQYWDSISTT